MDDSARGGESPATPRAPRRARVPPAAHTRNTSGRTYRPAAAAATRAADTPPGPPRQSTPRSPWTPRAGDRRQRATQLTRERGERLDQHRRPADDDECRPRRRRITAGPIGLAQAPPGAVALHGVLELSAHGKPRACGPGRLSPEHDERR